MKKVISLCLLGIPFMPLAADAAVTTYTGGSSTESETATAYDNADRNAAISKAAMRGWFVGLGLAKGGYKTTADETKYRYKWSGDIDIGAFDDPTVRSFLGAAGLPVDSITYEALSAGSTNLASFEDTGNVNYGIAKNKLNKLGALLVAGWGDFDGNLYYGLQIALDISGKKDTEVSKTDFGTVKLESKGFRPYFEVIFGRYFETIDALLYLKGGVTYSRAKLFSGNDAVKLGAFAPLIGVGAKKAVTENMTICTEAGYVFEVNKKSSLNGKGNYKLNKAGGSDELYEVSHEMEAKIRNRGYNIRVFATYNF